MPIKHLLKQIETYSAKRSSHDVRPDWLTAFVNEIAEIFEPIAGVARAGFDCQLAEDEWVVGMYLGCIETVGGMNDGRARYINFEFNLRELFGRFSRVDEFYLSAFPTPDTDKPTQARAFVTIAGLVDENPLRVQIFSIPPEDIGIGMRQFPDGRCETV